MLKLSDIGIVADDLTGACDVAACFAPKAGAVEVCLAPAKPPAGGQGLRVINTQTRLASPRTARRVSRQVGTWLAGKRIVFKKIDTGLRGPIGAELAGLLDGLRQTGHRWSCLVAPAAPAIGRTTRKGIQYDRGVPIDRGELADDPHSPPPSSNIRAVIERTGGGDCRIGDARNARDLRRLVARRLGTNRTVLAGSLGLAEALAHRLGAAQRRPAAGTPARRPMLICGSRHPRSIRQVERARRRGIRILDFDPVGLRFKDGANSGAAGIVLARILPGAAARGAPAPRRIMTAFIAALAPRLKRIGPDGVGIIGGETAYRLLRSMGAERLCVHRRQAEVIASARICGGTLDGCAMVCKGGSVGPDDAVLQMLALLTGATRKKR